MSEWTSYSAEDFLLFSPRTYWRLFELHNTATWPLHVAMVLLAAAILVGLSRRSPAANRVASVALAAVWLWVGWSFLAQRYATINWVAGYAAAAFFVQAMLIVLVGGLAGRLGVRDAGPMGRAAGLALFAYAAIVHPLTAAAAGRPIQAAEVFGVAPDPTAIATLGIAVMMRSAGAAWLLSAVPTLWCIASALTLYAMGAPEAWLPFGGAALAVAARLALDRRRKGGNPDYSVGSRRR